MGMEVIAFDPFISTERAQQMQVRLTTLEALFQQADYITLCTFHAHQTLKIW